MANKNVKGVPKTHYLKCETRFFQSIERGHKKFELRKNDRGFKKHDIVHFLEIVNGVFTGHKISYLEIQYVLYDDNGSGLLPGHCIFCW